MDKKYVLDESKTAIIDINVSEFTDNTIIFPAKVDGNKISSIGITEESLVNLTETFGEFNVIIENGIKTVEEKMFSYSSIHSISIPPSIETIPPQCFFGSCLQEVIFQGHSSLKTIGSAAFAFCNKLSSISLPLTIETIGDRAFRNAGLTEITFPERDAIDIKELAFVGCESLKRVIFPEISVNFGNQVFYNCTNLTSADMSKVNTNIISTNMFSNCSSLVDVKLPETNSLKKIKTAAFSYCSKLSSISLPSSVEMIADRAFRNTALEKVVFPKRNSLKIGELVFAECEHLKEVTFPEMGVVFKKHVFYRCGALETVDIAKANIDVISDGLFLSCESLKNITLPETVTVIGERAFCSCSSLTTVGLSKTKVSQIKNKAFKDCSCYSDGKFPDTLQKIGAQAFMCCDIDDLALPSFSLEEVGDQAFSENSLTKGIDLFPFANCETIGDYIFAGTDVKSIHLIPFNGANVSCKDMFFSCQNLQDVQMAKDSILYEGMFYNCFSLKTVSLPYTLKSIPDFAFHKTMSLKSIKFPDSLESIGFSSFRFSGLNEIDLSNLASVHIQSEAFASVYLKSVKLPSYGCELFNDSFDGDIINIIKTHIPFATILKS